MLAGVYRKRLAGRKIQFRPCREGSPCPGGGKQSCGSSDPMPLPCTDLRSKSNWPSLGGFLLPEHWRRGEMPVTRYYLFAPGLDSKNVLGGLHYALVNLGALVLFGHLFFISSFWILPFWEDTVCHCRKMQYWIPIYSFSKVPSGSRQSWYISPPRLPWPRTEEGSEKQGRSVGRSLLACFLSLFLCSASWICYRSSSRGSDESNHLESFLDPRTLPSIPPALFGMYWFSCCCPVEWLEEG